MGLGIGRAFWRASALITAAIATATVCVSPARAAPPAYVRTLGHESLAQINPGGIDVDAAGNVYVANTGNDTVARYDSGSATPRWVTGTRGGPVQQGAFEDPRDVAVLGSLVYVAEPAGVQVLDAATGTYLRNLRRGFQVPIGVTIGNTASGTPLILVSNGNSGAVDVFDAGESFVRSIPALTADAGTRDAATDSQGNFYVADYRNDRINKYSPAGVLLTQWGGRNATTCQRIPRPYGVAVDDADHVYVAASNSNLIRSFNSDGSCIRTYGQNGFGTTQTSQLRRVAVGVGPAPLVYSADLWGLKVLIYKNDGTLASPLWRLGDGTYPEPGGLNEVPAVAAGPNGIYATDMNDHRITRWKPDGTGVMAWGRKGKTATQAEFNWPQGIGINPVNGHVWVGDTHSNNIKEFGPDGGLPLRTFGSAGNAPGKFNWPGNIAFDAAGNMYVCDMSNGRVQSFSPTMAFRWAATGLSRPVGIAFDPLANRVLVTSAGASKVFALNPASGARTDLGIPRGGSPGQVLAPQGVAVAADGSFWVGDTGNDRVQKFTANGTYAGVGIGAGRGQANNQFNKPMGLAIGPDGLLYVADAYNSRVQVFDIG